MDLSAEEEQFSQSGHGICSGLEKSLSPFGYD